MSSILVVDDMAIFRDPIAASLRLAGYTTFCAMDGLTGLALLRTQHPDLVLLDVAMPGMDGISFLRALRRDLSATNTPVILLTALADPKIMIEAAKLGVRDYLLKSQFSLADLNDRIKRLLGAKSVPPAPPEAAPSDGSGQDPEPAMTDIVPPPGNDGPGPEPFVPEKLVPLLNRYQCVSRVEACMAGKTLSGAVADVLMLASRPSAELKDLSGLIARDPVLSVRVLQMANSAAFYSRRGTVTTIPDAVKNIGASNVRNIAASVGIFDSMPASSPDGFNPILCWQHSFAVARLCEGFITPTALQKAGVAYLVGLCHDLGEIMFRTQFEREYKAVLDEQERSGAALEDIERRLLGMTHIDILKVILKCIGLPETIRDPILQFQKSGKYTDEQTAVSRALAMAEAYANGLLLVSSDSSLISPISEKDWLALSGQTRLAVPDGEGIRSQVQCLTAILSRMNPADQATLMKSPPKKIEARIWLARDSAYCTADPVATALCEFANVELHAYLPTPDEINNYSALVVEGRGRNTPNWNRAAIESSLKGNPQLPLLWFIQDGTAMPGNLPFEPVQAASLRAIKTFIGKVDPAARRAVA